MVVDTVAADDIAVIDTADTAVSEDEKIVIRWLRHIEHLCNNGSCRRYRCLAKSRKYAPSKSSKLCP